MDYYIPISRRLFEHQLWCEERVFSRFEAWLDILQSARFEDTRQLIGNRMIDVRRGQALVSLRFLAGRWQWSTKKVNAFLDLLIQDKMITKETPKETGQTVITVCNYDRYNPMPPEQETQRKQQGNSKETPWKQQGNKNNKEKKDKKENNIKTNKNTNTRAQDEKSVEEKCLKIFRYFNEMTEYYKSSIRPVRMLTDERRRKLESVVRRFTAEQIAVAVRNAMTSDYLNGRTPRRKLPADFDWLFDERNFVKIFEGSV